MAIQTAVHALKTKFLVFVFAFASLTMFAHSSAATTTLSDIENFADALQFEIQNNPYLTLEDLGRKTGDLALKYQIDLEQLAASMAMRQDYQQIASELANGSISLNDSYSKLTEKSRFHKTGGAGGPVPGPITIGLLAVVAWKAVVATAVVVGFVYGVRELYELMHENDVTCEKGQYYLRKKVRNAAYMAAGELVMISPAIVAKVFGQKQSDCTPDKIEYFKSSFGHN